MIQRFFNYVELRTKITTLFTFLFTLTVIGYWRLEFKVLELGIFFISLFLIDLTTTAINNYIDSKGNGGPTGYSDRTGLAIITVMLSLAILFGLYLVSLTDWIILLAGMFSFAVGILYTFGPIPISRQPYGEVISGVMQGYFVAFIMIHIADPTYLFTIQLQAGIMTIGFALERILQFLLAFMVPTLVIAAIMLANNTCDVEKDILVKRYTLPYYLGQKRSVQLMYLLYIMVFVSIVISSLVGYLPLTSLLTVLLSPIVFRNIATYAQKLQKDVSFVYLIRNHILVMSGLTLTTFLGLFI